MAHSVHPPEHPCLPNSPLIVHVHLNSLIERRHLTNYAISRPLCPHIGIPHELLRKPSTNHGSPAVPSHHFRQPPFRQPQPHHPLPQGRGASRSLFFPFPHRRLPSAALHRSLPPHFRSGPVQLRIGRLLPVNLSSSSSLDSFFPLRQIGTPFIFASRPTLIPLSACTQYYIVYSCGCR